MHVTLPVTLTLSLTPAALGGLALPLLRHLGFAALQGALFILAVRVICRLAPRLPAGLRCTLWWLASLKLVLGLLWPAPLALPLLPAALAAPLARWNAAVEPFTARAAGRDTRPLPWDGQDTLSSPARIGNAGENAAPFGVSGVPGVPGGKAIPARTDKVGVTGPALGVPGGTAIPARTGKAGETGPASGVPGGKAIHGSGAMAEAAGSNALIHTASLPAQPAARLATAGATSGLAGRRTGGLHRQPGGPPATEPASLPARRGDRRFQGAAPFSLTAAYSLFTLWLAPALAAAWLLGVMMQLGALAREGWLLRRLLARTRPVADEALRGLADGLCRRLGLPAVEVRLAPEAAPPGGPDRADAPRRRSFPAPFTARSWRPVVVLPAASLASLSPEEAAMTVCHELMHVRRRDLLWGWMPAIAARLFFFLPLAREAAREYALAREAACDNAVLRLLGAPPMAYGGLLLRLAVAAPDRRRTATATMAESWAAPSTVASATSSLQQLKRRLEMLEQSPATHPRPRRQRRLGFASLGLVAVAALVPFRLVSATPDAATASTGTAAPILAETSTSPASAAARPAVASGAMTTRTVLATTSASPALAGSNAGSARLVTASLAGTITPAANPANPADTADAYAPNLAPAAEHDAAEHDAAEHDAHALDTADADDEAGFMDADQPEPPEPPAPPAPRGTYPTPPVPGAPPAPPVPAAPPAPPAGRSHSSSYSYRYSSDDNGDAYVLFHGGGNAEMTMSGDTGDIKRASELRRKAGGGELLWLRRGGREYVISDAATLREVEEIFRPQRELGDKQGMLGDRQGKLGDTQGELGERQGELGERQGKLGEEQGRLAEEEARLAVANAGRSSGEISAADQKRRDELRDRRERAAAEMAKLGAEQRQLGEQQRRLGDQQRELGNQQKELGRAQRLASREAQHKLDALLERAIAGGIAHPAK
jgi:Zn-dependent protease with chaperone function